MTIHSLILGAVFATLYGAILHLWRGGGLGKLLFYVFMSWIGFWVGHNLGSHLSWGFVKIGPLYVGAATLGSVILLFIAAFLSDNATNPSLKDSQLKE